MVKKFWDGVSNKLDVGSKPPANMREIAESKSKLYRWSSLIIIYSIWDSRNKATFDGIKISPDSIIAKSR